MKLSAFSNFSDLNATPVPAGIGAAAAPFTEPGAQPSSAGDTPAIDTANSDFAAIFGGIAYGSQSGCDLPKLAAIDLPSQPAIGLLDESPRAMRPLGSLSQRDIEPESLDAAGTATVEVTESCEAPRGNVEKGRASRRGPEVKPQPGLPAEHAAWAHAFATPTAFAATPVTDCALPVPDDCQAAAAGSGHIEHGSRSAATNANPAFAVLSAQPRGLLVNSFESRQLRSEANSDTGISHAQADANPTEREPNQSCPNGQSTPAAVPLPDNLSAPTHGGGAPHVLPRASTAADPAAVAAHANSDTGLSHADVDATPPEREQNPSSPAATVTHAILDTTQANVQQQRPNMGVGLGGVRLGRDTSRASRAEKNSGASAEHRQDDVAHEFHGDKNLLTTDIALLTKSHVGAGTGSAKPGSLMSTATLSTSEPNAFAADAALAPAFNAGAEKASTGEAASIECTAQNAVETIFSLAERVASADAQSINLRFSIGDNDLRVRVGYWGDEVRATFLTESPELRATLLQEWQSLGSPAADRASVRFADPVFSSAAQGDASNSSFDSASQQHRESAARRENSSAPVDIFRPRVSDRDFTTPAPGLPVRGLPTSTQRLHTFA